jgi:hypothetical protein
VEEDKEAGRSAHTFPTHESHIGKNDGIFAWVLTNSVAPQPANNKNKRPVRAF